MVQWGSFEVDIWINFDICQFLRIFFGDFGKEDKFGVVLGFESDYSDFLYVCVGGVSMVKLKVDFIFINLKVKGLLDVWINLL